MTKKIIEDSENECSSLFSIVKEVYSGYFKNKRFWIFLIIFVLLFLFGLLFEKPVATISGLVLIIVIGFMIPLSELLVIWIELIGRKYKWMFLMIINFYDIVLFLLLIAVWRYFDIFNFTEFQKNIENFWSNTNGFLLILTQIMLLIMNRIQKFSIIIRQISSIGLLMYLFLSLNYSIETIYLFGEEVFMLNLVGIFLIFIIKLALYTDDVDSSKNQFNPFFPTYFRINEALDILPKTGSIYGNLLKIYKFLRDGRKIKFKLSKSDDSPIQKSSDDKFYQGILAEEIYYYLQSSLVHDKIDSTTIGVVSSWGTGKTGILNILRNKYLSLIYNSIVFEFKPNNFNPDVLTQKFLTDFGNKLSIINFGGLIIKYSELLKTVIPKDVLPYLEGIKNLFSSNLTLEELKNKINERIIKSKKKIIIILDDLDRCTPSEILAVFNLVKNQCSFSNTVFILAYDKQIILNTLSNSNYPEAYLEKIINFEFFIPENKIEDNDAYFSDLINNIFTNILENFKLNGIILSEKQGKLFSEENISSLLLSTYGLKETTRFQKNLYRQFEYHLNRKLFSGENNIIETIEKIEPFDFLGLILSYNYLKMKNFSLFTKVINKRGNDFDEKLRAELEVLNKNRLLAYFIGSLLMKKESYVDLDNKYISLLNIIHSK